MSEFSLEPLWPFIERHFPTANGRPRTKQSTSKILAKLGIKVQYFGNLALIDPAEVLEKLRDQPFPYEAQRRYNKSIQQPRRRGRPPVAAE